MAAAPDPARNKIISKVSYELTVFTDSLNPSKEFIKIGKETTQKIFTLIQGDGRYKVDRCLIGGSVGKNTSVLYPDFDGVIFLYNKEPPLWETVNEFEHLLKKNADSYGIIQESITTSSNTVTVEFENGTELDLLPACRYSQDVEIQVEKVLENIKKYEEKFGTFSSSLADIQIEFIRSQPGLTHQLIRLVKYWYKTLTLDDKVFGGSYLMEVLSVTVCHEHEKLAKKSVPLLESFKAVLKKISKINSLKIAFIRKKKVWKLLSENEIGNHKAYFSHTILQRKHYIIDPSNPYNDLEKNLSEDVVCKLKNYAEKMLKRIEALESTESNEFKTVLSPSDVTIHIEKIFQPLSLSLKDPLSKYPLASIPNEIVVHYDYQNYKSPEAKVVPISDSFFQNNNKAMKVSKAISINLVTLVRNKVKRVQNGTTVKYDYVNGLADFATKVEVKGAVKELIDTNFDSKSVKVSATNSDHKGCDVTLYVPYSVKGTTWAIRLSMKWNVKK